MTKMWKRIPSMPGCWRNSRMNCASSTSSHRLTHCKCCARRVLESLTAWQRKQTPPEPGPNRAPEAALCPRISLEPPKPYYAHPYFLGMQFFGRQAELAQLDAWATAAEPVMIIDAIGGAGKSALTWHWMREHAPRVFPKTDGILWWSFYEADATMPLVPAPNCSPI